MAQTYTTYYLEMTSPDQLNAKPQRSNLQIVECEEPQPALNRFLYQLVGSTWEWGDLDSWDDAQWQAMVENPAH